MSSYLYHILLALSHADAIPFPFWTHGSSLTLLQNFHVQTVCDGPACWLETAHGVFLTRQISISQRTDCHLWVEHDGETDSASQFSESLRYAALANRLRTVMPLPSLAGFCLLSPLIHAVLVVLTRT